MQGDSSSVCGFRCVESYNPNTAGRFVYFLSESTIVVLPRESELDGGFKTAYEYSDWMVRKKCMLRSGLFLDCVPLYAVELFTEKICPPFL